MKSNIATKRGLISNCSICYRCTLDFGYDNLSLSKIRYMSQAHSVMGLLAFSAILRCLWVDQYMEGFRF